MPRLYAVMLVLACLSFVGVSGCGASSAEIQSHQNSDAPSDPEILYNAILEEYRHRGIDIDVASAKHLLVAGAYESVNEQVRRRYVSKLVVFPNGVALNIKANYERKNTSEGQITWQAVDTAAIVQKAKREENDLGVAIQKRFKAMRKE